jgi:ribosomal-protein-alanine N-acetyltransferase
MELKGQGFTLREWKLEDAESLQKHADNTNVSDFLLDRFPSPYTMDNAIHWINQMQSQNPLKTFVIAVENELAGAIGLELREDVYRKSPLIGYWIGEGYWGSGIMAEAVKLITAYAFTNFDVIRIQAGVFGNNPKSMRVLEKAGFTKEGIMKNAIVKKGLILDEHIYAIYKD